MTTKKRASGVAGFARLDTGAGHKYRVEITWSEDDGCYVARVPELPGCMTDGATLSDVASNADEAIRSYIGALKKEGRPVPVPLAERSFSGKIPLRIDPRLHRDLALKAELEDMSLNKYIEEKLARVK